MINLFMSYCSRVYSLKGRGLAAGIPHFNLDRLAANSMASHRLIQHVGKQYGLNVSEKLYDRLNIFYFVDGHSLNDRPRLAKVAAEVLADSIAKDSANQRMTEDEILTFLNGNEGRTEIANALQALHQIGVHGIPKFIIEGTTVVDGAARPESFINIFREIEQRGSIARKPIFGSILGVDDETIQEGSHTRESMLG